MALPRRGVDGAWEEHLPTYLAVKEELGEMAMEAETEAEELRGQVRRLEERVDTFRLTNLSLQLVIADGTLKDENLKDQACAEVLKNIDDKSMAQDAELVAAKAEVGRLTAECAEVPGLRKRADAHAAKIAELDTLLKELQLSNNYYKDMASKIPGFVSYSKKNKPAHVGGGRTPSQGGATPPHFSPSTSESAPSDRLRQQNEFENIRLRNEQLAKIRREHAVELNSLREERDKAKLDLSASTAAVHHQEKEMSKLKDELEKQMLQTAQVSNSKAVAEETYKQSLAGWEERNHNLAAQVKDLKSQRDLAAGKLETKSAELSAAQARIGRVEANLASAVKELAAESDKTRAAVEAQRETEEKVGTLQANLEEKDRRHNEELVGLSTSRERDRVQQSESAASLSSEAADLRTQLSEELRSERAELEGRQTAATAALSKSQRRVRSVEAFLVGFLDSTDQGDLDPGAKAADPYVPL